MTEQAEREAAHAGSDAVRGPSVLELIGEKGMKRVAWGATPLWSRLTGKGKVAERTLREILAAAHTVGDVDVLYRERHWRRADYRARPRRGKVLPALRKMGVPER